MFFLFPGDAFDCQLIQIFNHNFKDYNIFITIMVSEFMII